MKEWKRGRWKREERRKEEGGMGGSNVRASVPACVQAGGRAGGRGLAVLCRVCFG